MTEWLITLWAHLFHPRALVLTQDQAEYVQGLLLGGASPEDIGRAMDKMHGRQSWKYFQSWNSQELRFEWTTPVAYDIDGIEYIWSAMVKLRALRKRGREYYYQADHPMTRIVADAASKAAIPQKREA